MGGLLRQCLLFEKGESNSWQDSCLGIVKNAKFWIIYRTP